MIIKSDISISVKDIKIWISKSNSVHSLQSIRAKTNKRIKSLVRGHQESPFKNIPVWIKRIILQPLFVEQRKIEYKPYIISAKKEKEDKMEKDNLNNFAVYFNNKYIGEATSCSIIRGSKKSMSLIKIKGDYSVD